MQITPEGLLDDDGRLYLPADYNPRLDLKPGDRGWKKLQTSLETFEDASILVVNAQTGRMIGGHQRLKVMRHLGWRQVEVRVNSYTEQMEKALNVALNNPEIGGDWDYDKLPGFLRTIDEDVLPLTGWDEDQVAAIVKMDDMIAGAAGDLTRTLVEQFVAPPFSVLDARQGYWKKRKAAWMALGIRSEMGRGENLLHFSDTALTMGKGKAISYKGQSSLNAMMKQKNAKLPEDKRKALGSYDAYGGATIEREGGGFTGTSIFDPVLCELLYRWFVPEGGSILDPFAGGSVRGVVAAYLGRPYTGIDLSADQVRENERQWEEIGPRVPGIRHFEPLGDNLPDLTPIEEHGGHLVKRDDLFTIAGVSGGKVRTCWVLAQGAKGLITAGARASPQCNIVAQIAKRLGVPCRLHIPKGQLSVELQKAKEAGAVIKQHPAGYNTVIIKRAKDDAIESGWTYIPFGMECQEAVAQTRRQINNIPGDLKRIVVPIGSGMSASGILWGLRDRGLDIPVLGIQVGADPIERLNTYAPPDWARTLTIIKSPLPYETPAQDTDLSDLHLDPIYEAKCLPYLQDGDLLWVVGIRQSENQDRDAAIEPPPDPQWINGDSLNIEALLPAGKGYDFLFTCPPYYDLEQYSDEPGDLSNIQTYDEFLVIYRKIIKAGVARLNPDRFAAIVVGEIRDETGACQEFVADTVKAFTDCGCVLYNDAVLLTSIGSLPIRVGRQFRQSRKLGKAHQNVLVFYKGDQSKIDKVHGPLAMTEDALEQAVQDAIERETGNGSEEQ